MGISDDTPPKATKLRADALARWENEGGLASPRSRLDDDHAVTPGEAGRKAVDRQPVL